MALNERPRRRLQRLAVEQPLQPQLQLHGIDIGRLRIIERVEQQPLLQRRERQDILDLRVMALQPLDLGLRERHQRQIGGRASAGAGRRPMAHQRLQRPEPALGQIANRVLRHQRRRPGPGRRQLGSLGIIERERIDLERVGERQIAAAEPHRLGRRRPSPPIPPPRSDRDS